MQGIKNAKKNNFLFENIACDAQRRLMITVMKFA